MRALMKVVKRDGSVVDYDRSKIITAIQKANAEVSEEEQLSLDRIEAIVSRIEDLGRDKLPVEEIQDLVEQGLVAKYVVDGTSSACFEYLGHDEHCHKHICFHCKCEKCGKVIHLECGEMTHLGEHMLEDHGFQWDFTRTVFYGICEECRGK